MVPTEVVGVAAIECEPTRKDSAAELLSEELVRLSGDPAGDNTWSVLVRWSDVGTVMWSLQVTALVVVVVVKAVVVSAVVVTSGPHGSQLVSSLHQSKAVGVVLTVGPPTDHEDGPPDLVPVVVAVIQQSVVAVVVVGDHRLVAESDHAWWSVVAVLQ